MQQAMGHGLSLVRPSAGLLTTGLGLGLMVLGFFEPLGEAIRSGLRNRFGIRSNGPNKPKTKTKTYLISRKSSPYFFFFSFSFLRKKLPLLGYYLITFA